MDELEARCEALARTPGIGTARPELGQGVRMLPHARFLVFYRLDTETVRVERVLHGARDIDADDLDLPSPGAPP